MLQYIEGRVIVEVDMNAKNFHSFEDGTKIKLQRMYDNFNMRYVAPVQGKVISAEHIPKGATLLFHHNGTHDTFRVFNYKTISGEDIASDIRYFSIEYAHCYLWSTGNEIWNPAYGFETALRIFTPYNGFILGVKPTKLDNVLYITSGKLNGKACHTLRAADYEVVFQGFDGREKRMIRIRHWDDQINPREEIIGINNWLTEKITHGEYLVGLTPSDATPIKQLVNA